MSTIFLVDDDDSVRQLLQDSLAAGGYQPLAFKNGKDFLDYFDGQTEGCVILDFTLPDLNGLEVMERLRRRGAMIPILFISGCSDVRVGVAAIQQGAFDFLTKPFRLRVLFERIDVAISQNLQDAAVLRDFHSRFSRLTPREREVMQLIRGGVSTKGIASQLGVTIQTAIKHRGRVLEKMRVDNDVQLVHLVNSADALSSPIL